MCAYAGIAPQKEPPNCIKKIDKGNPFTWFSRGNGSVREPHNGGNGLARGRDLEAIDFLQPPQGLIIRELETSLGRPSYNMLLRKSFIFPFGNSFGFPAGFVDTQFLENSTRLSEPGFCFFLPSHNLNGLRLPEF